VSSRKSIPKFKPSIYKISVKPGRELAELEITGQKFGAPNKRIELCQKGLKVRSAKITYHQKNTVVEHEVIRINHLPTFEQVRLHTNSPLYPGNYQIVLEFSPYDAAKLKQLEGGDLSSQALRELLPSFDKQAARIDAKIEITN